MISIAEKIGFLKPPTVSQALLGALNGDLGVARCVTEGISKLHPRRVLLFGSRARGTAHEHSDFDLLWEGVTVPDLVWRAFLGELTETPWTLAKMDWIRAEDARPELLHEALRDGRIIYEKI